MCSSKRENNKNIPLASVRRQFRKYDAKNGCKLNGNVSIFGLSITAANLFTLFLPGFVARNINEWAQHIYLTPLYGRYRAIPSEDQFELWHSENVWSYVMNCISGFSAPAAVWCAIYIIAIGWITHSTVLLAYISYSAEFQHRRQNRWIFVHFWHWCNSEFEIKHNSHTNEHFFFSQTLVIAIRVNIFNFWMK